LPTLSPDFLLIEPPTFPLSMPMEIAFIIAEGEGFHEENSYRGDSFHPRKRLF